VLSAIALLAAGCAGTQDAFPPRALRLEIQAGKIAEECFSLAAGERVDYQFEATTPVDFNFHTHRGGEIVMPVNVQRTRAQAGVFSSPAAEDYCMMWTNGAAVPSYVTAQWKRLRR